MIASDATSSTFKTELYAASTDGQRQLNFQALNVMQASLGRCGNREQQILDLGSGTGDFTRDGLLPRCLPCRRIVAVDASRDMVEYAKKHSAHPKICYDVLDILGDGVADFVKLYGQFDRVYSFFCLNWVRDQERALKNVAALLKPDGCCLFQFSAASIRMRLQRRKVTVECWNGNSQVRKNSVPPSTGGKGKVAHISYILGLLRNANLAPVTCEVLSVKGHQTRLKNMIEVQPGFTYPAVIETGEEKPLLLKQVAEEAIKLWADREFGRSPSDFNCFLVLARKNREQLPDQYSHSCARKAFSSTSGGLF